MLGARLVRFSVERPKMTIGTILAITVVFGAFLPRMQVDTDPKNMLAPTSAVRVGNDEVEARFGLHADVIVVGVVSDRGIFRPGSLNRIRDLTAKIVDIDGVVARDVASLAITNNVVTTTVGMEVRPPLTRAVASDEEAEAIKTAVLSNPLFVDRLVSKDGTTAAIYVPLQKGANGKEVADKIRGLIQDADMPEATYVAGDPVARDTFGAEMFLQMGFFSPLAGMIMFIALIIIFRNLWIVASCMVVAMISIVWAMGLHIALGYTVHIMSSMMPVFLMAIATDAIHIFNEMGFRLRGGMDRRQAILESMTAVGRPVMFTDLTTAAGFASLATADVPPVRIFGIFVAFGTLAILLLSFTFIPAVLAIADESRLRASAIRTEPRPLITGRALTALGRLAVTKSAAISAIGVVLLVGAGFGMSRIRLNNNMVAWFKEGSPVRAADRILNARLGGTALGYLVVSGRDGGYKRPDALRFLEGLEAELTKLPRVGKVTSIVDAVKQVNAVLPGSEWDRRVPDSDEAIAQELLLLGSGGRPADVDNFVDYPLAKANMFVQLKTWDADAMAEVIERARGYLAQHPFAGAEIVPAGIAYFNLVWNHEVLRGMLSSFASGLVLVLVLLVWEYRSIAIGILAFLPLLFTTALIYGAIGLMGKDFDMPISVLSTLSLGMAIDFAIHFVSRLRQRLAEPDPGTLDQALAWTVERPGLGIVRNAIMFALGFAVMAFSSLTPYITVGVFMAAIMLISSLATLLYLPALFRLFPGLLKRKAPAIAAAPVATMLAIGIVLSSGSALADGPKPDADEIAKRSLLAFYYPGKDFRAKIAMKLQTKGGDVRERQIAMLRKNEGEPGGNQRYFLYFHKPDDVRRTAFLVWKYPEKDDDRWLFLPAVDVVRRIAASDRRSSFVGSDFTYEDISGRDLAADTRKLLGTEKLGDVGCFVIESLPKEEAEYGKKVSWIETQTYLPKKEEYYDRRGQLYKVFTADALETVKGFPTITRRTMKDVSTGHVTTVEMSAIDYGVGVEDEVFTERFLRRPPKRWIE
jgi:predicted RND superfamily exporter protein/outer membrane lipoprotein-sorting protein